MTKGKKSDYEWFLKADLSQYKGKYVAIVDRKIVSSGKNAKSVYLKALKRLPKTRPTLAKIPPENMMVLLVVSNDKLH
ncbi:MAG: hypothetical protein ACD_52C00325G0005 [uncultured bacterium]|uniref:DUF5678 domain-containing protein n=1 Tax=Candidatus Woesebacteria bacterium RIFCSPHIGHO2_12_FULL_41_24 TaxID=1802510 RepID=A0A1F8AQN2_9BACT|nr:MAG: hypothetical protein ACD_52C00325G0005 [uncultured bacterium]OGM15105.1 MAG: hypothetical protein A2W15_06390 [Candidatus Woesebacteria bacterium RBG_16_41_13]OGM28658.1 MAG: hypothetical protein A2873_05575 [Candidatus Woesebacteria bacterium RIFCSPHIGHO2_01_FULL_42_80]OGM34444.1 MAG: hypothetical protein A3D84_04505 [Candidatus Woesebacteria bacterium RIFCSPHIGHO2_02_FULL_42_20]OGM54082.1 MAG: hypothetical protein A3E44_02660 [Candidatus Woesebacteria bacterium RIFCSPHIGHO2_12_FULL_41